jgi:hypothetical protein
MPSLVVLDAVSNRWHDAAFVSQFHASFIDDGRLVERVADATELSRTQRRKKWNDASLVHYRNARLHREQSDLNTRWSDFLFRCRTENVRCYESVATQLREQFAPTQHPPKEWMELILMHENRAHTKPDSFWQSIQTSRLTMEQKRAVLHKLLLCRPRISYPIHSRCMELSEHIFVQDQRATGVNAGDERRRRRWRRWVRRLLKSMRPFVTRRVVCAPGDSNT